MPWKKKKKGGYRTRREGHIKNPGQYEKLRQKGMSKRKAARIANSKN